MSSSKASAGDKPQEKDPVTFQPIKIQYRDLKEFTQNFSEKVYDESAQVWKGVLPDGTEIAVKKLDQKYSPLARGEEFGTKVQHIIELKHENIVQMVGFCRREEETTAEGGGAKVVETFLCYRYLPKGSLDTNIFGNSKVEWNIRFKIIEGICHGLRCMHTRNVRILHMDLKPGTILLDDNMSPKIADFGLARLIETTETTKVPENERPPHAYMAPEYKYSGEISTWSDIYSLGVLILEITTGEKRSAPANEDPSSRKYIDKIRRVWTLEHIASAYAVLSSNRLQEVKVCIEVGLECVQIENTRRPTIEAIIDKLTERRSAS